jgi:hypothetical protein
MEFSSPTIFQPGQRATGHASVRPAYFFVEVTRDKLNPH